jgi:hypothetical protein
MNWTCRSRQDNNLGLEREWIRVDIGSGAEFFRGGWEIIPEFPPPEASAWLAQPMRASESNPLGAVL